MSPVASLGLTPEEAARRLAADGPNRLPAQRRPRWWSRLGAQFVHFFALMLWVAAGLALVAGLPEIAVAIVGVVVVNSLFSFVQEERSERAAERLVGLLPQRATVRRRGAPLVIDAAEVVVGDLVVLEAGDRITADAVVVAAHGLLVDNSAMTGESQSVPVGDEGAVWAGTFVLEGSADVEVTATGARTQLAAIASLTAGVRRPPTPLAIELRHLVRTVAIVACSVGAAFFGLTFLADIPASEGVVFAIGITVALVPEGLLPTTTLSLAMGARRMAQRNALVRRLESVETLGSTTFICTDKTGTLTTNQMAVIEVWTPVGSLALAPTAYVPEPVPDDAAAPEVLEVVRCLAGRVAGCAGGAVVLEGDRWVPHGDPQEVALHVLARRVGAEDDHDVTAEQRFAFDPMRRRMSVVRKGEIVVKGAPDGVLPLCGFHPLGAEAALARLTGRGLRVLAVAGRPRQHGESLRSAADAEHGLELWGFVALEDPPRAGVEQSVAACRAAGIAVAMVTGDHPRTALAIAREVGLALEGAPVLEGADLPADDEVLAAVVDRDGLVVARVSPPDKLRIASALRRRGHVVAMTGDGVNDGPALREADIGVAMGATGTDVAREAADLVLLDDDFSTIVAAIAEGRATFANIRRFLTYHLTDNVAELTPFAVWALSGGRFPLALGVLQVLALDLVTDTLPAVALGAERPAPDVLERGPVRGRLLNATTARRAFGVLGPTEALLSMTAFTVSLLVAGWRPPAAPATPDLVAASGAAFIAVVAGQMANAFACRSATRPAWAVRPANPLVRGAVVVAGAIGVTTLVWAPVAGVLGQGTPTLPGLAVVAVTPAVVLGIDGIDKWWRRRRSVRPALAGPEASVSRRSVAQDGRGA